MPKPKGTMLLVEPFSDWLKHLVAVHGDAYTARLTGLDERQIFKYKNLTDYSRGHKYRIRTVSLRIVDEALTSADTDLILWDLYPELFEGAAA